MLKVSNSFQSCKQKVKLTNVFTWKRVENECCLMKRNKIEWMNKHNAKRLVPWRTQWLVHNFMHISIIYNNSVPILWR